jgi:hypothetical protein
MARPARMRERLLAAFLFALLALNPPILSIFSARLFIFGIPLLFLYLFLVWAAIIVVLAWVSDLGPQRDGER